MCLGFHKQRLGAGAISDGGGSSACLVRISDGRERVSDELKVDDRDVRPSGSRSPARRPHPGRGAARANIAPLRYLCSASWVLVQRSALCSGEGPTVMHAKRTRRVCPSPTQSRIGGAPVMAALATVADGGELRVIGWARTQRLPVRSVNSA
jgi:hypothetical protein